MNNNNNNGIWIIIIIIMVFELENIAQWRFSDNTSQGWFCCINTIFTLNRFKYAERLYC